MQTPRISFHHQQRGMTLLVGLILLVMLTVIGLVGFRNVTMTERMSGNSSDRNVSFQSSESAGKEALDMIETAFSSGVFTNLTTGATGYFSTPFVAGAETAFWSGGEDPPFPSTGPIPTCPYLPSTTTFNWKCSAPVGTAYARNYQAAQYVVEMLSAFDDTGAPIALPVTPVVTTNFKYNFRVTTRSTGGSGGAEVLLQTIYTRVNP